MIRPLVFTLATLWLTQAAAAESVLVRTAEHAGFTRVVVDFTDRPNWKLGRAGDGYELRTDGAEIVYDLRDVYRRIYDGRLLSIDAAGAGNLRLVTGCDCALSTALRDNGGLIIDIADTAPAKDNPYERSLVAPAPDTPASPRVALPLMLDPIAPTILPMLADDSIRRAAAELGADLGEKIGRAAELDLIELTAGVPADSLTRRNRSTAETGTDTPQNAEMSPITMGPNLRIVTEAERALSDRGLANSVDSSLCDRLERLLDPNGWVSEGVGPAGIKLDRKALVDVRGKADARGFRDLIRGYLYLTFGREAAAALRAAPDDLTYRSLYAALANLVETRPVGNTALAGMTDCPGHTGLWARLADPGAPAYRGDTSRALAFAGWPVQLRRALGPQLATAYLDNGDEDTARAIFSATARVAAPDDSAFLLLAARLADPPSHDAAQDQEMAEIAQTRRPESVRALLKVIDARIAEDMPVGTDLAMQAGALAFELADTEDAKDLRAAEIRALVHDRLWRAAVTRLEAHEAVADRDALLSDLVAAAAAGANDTDLLWLAARMEGEHGVSRHARAEMAARIARLGVAEMARAALDLGAAIPTADERRILAEIALLEDRPAIAEAYLAGLETETDQTLRARAAAMRTRQTAATEAGYVTPPPPGVTTADGTASTPPAPVDVTRSPPAILPERGLAASRDLLGNSADLRNELEALLAASRSQ